LIKSNIILEAKTNNLVSYIYELEFKNLSLDGARYLQTYL